jgi:glycosyltransferase involved in cell wall biosynthesis
MIKVFKNRVPFFSVIIPTFNRSAMLRRAVSSLSNQSETDWEALIIDDGSTDDTPALVKAFARSNPRIKYIYHSNRGPALSKNAGILAASGLFLAFLDSDDEYREDHLALHRKILHQNPGLDMIHGGVRIIGDRSVPDINDKEKMIDLAECIIGGTFVIKKEKAIAMAGFDAVDYGEDRLLYEKAKNAGITIARNYAETYIYRRDHEESICNKVKSRYR